MKKMLLIAVLLVFPALAADNANSTSKPLSQETQIKLLKAQRQLQQIQMQMTNLQRQYDEAVKQAKELQTQMSNDCADAAKQANVDMNKFSCDLDSLAFVPKPEEKKTAAEKK